MTKYFSSRLIYFPEPEAMKIKPESEVCCQVVYSGLDIFTAVVFTMHWYPVKLAVGLPNTQLIF